MHNVIGKWKIEAQPRTVEPRTAESSPAENSWAEGSRAETTRGQPTQAPEIHYFYYFWNSIALLVSLVTQRQGVPKSTIPHLTKIRHNAPHQNPPKDIKWTKMHNALPTHHYRLKLKCIMHLYSLNHFLHLKKLENKRNCIMHLHWVSMFYLPIALCIFAHFLLYFCDSNVIKETKMHNALPPYPYILLKCSMQLYSLNIFLHFKNHKINELASYLYTKFFCIICQSYYAFSFTSLIL